MLRNFLIKRFYFFFENATQYVLRSQITGTTNSIADINLYLVQGANFQTVLKT